MDCKKALEEADGDFDKAIELLAIKWQRRRRARRRARGHRRPGRTLRRRARRAQVRDRLRRQERRLHRRRAADRRCRATARPRRRCAQGRGAGWQDRRRDRRDLAITIGEKIELGACAYFDGPVVAYLHKRAADLPPAVGVLVEYEGDAQAARAAAMQIAAMRAQYLTREEVPADVVAKEREIAETTSLEEGKPERRSRRSPRVGSTASSRTSSCSSSPRSPRTRRPSRRFSTRPAPP